MRHVFLIGCPRPHLPLNISSTTSLAASYSAEMAVNARQILRFESDGAKEEACHGSPCSWPYQAHRMATRSPSFAVVDEIPTWLEASKSLPPTTKSLSASQPVPSRGLPHTSILALYQPHISCVARIPPCDPTAR